MDRANNYFIVISGVEVATQQRKQTACARTRRICPLLRSFFTQIYSLPLHRSFSFLSMSEGFGIRWPLFIYQLEEARDDSQSAVVLFFQVFNNLNFGGCWASSWKFWHFACLKQPKCRHFFWSCKKTDGGKTFVEGKMQFSLYWHPHDILMFSSLSRWFTSTKISFWCNRINVFL